MQILVRSLIVIFLFAGCKTYKAKYPYSLSDFNPELRSQLERIIENGGMCDIDNYDDPQRPEYYKYFSEKVTVNDLHKLIDCEHPVLRAYAFNTLCYKKDIDTTSLNQILLNHLDDTATITVCEGEWGEKYASVSDFFISRSERKTKILKSELVEKVIMNHSYLSYAYFFIKDSENSEEKYYSVIKQMAANPRGMHMTEKEAIALNALSKYKKREDIPFIAERLSKNWTLSEYNYDSCFSIIVHNPDIAFFKIIERFYGIISRPQNKEEVQHNFYTSYLKLREKYNSFLEALISYKNKRSSEMLDTIINREIYPVYSSRGENYRYDIYKLLKKNECPEYKKLIKLLEPEAIAIEKRIALNQLDLMQIPADTSLFIKRDPRYW